MSGRDSGVNAPPKLVFLGPPGAGKGTQGALLAERCGIPKYATGDILREAVQLDSPLGRESKGYMQRGELVPDEVIIGLARNALASPSAKAGFILDGFPRTIGQAEALQAILAESGRTLDAVLYFAVLREELIRRLAGRRVCGDCGAVFNIHSDPPAIETVCDRCNGQLGIREDDEEETVLNRLDVYDENTQPLLAWYRTSSVPVHEIDAGGTVEDVYERLLKAVGCS